MTTAALGTTDTRTRLIEAAIDLFTRHSFAGTSLQMIADELGFTKAAIYHHFRTREQLLAAVIEPMLDELRTVVESAETKRTPHARAEHMLSGYAALFNTETVIAGLFREVIAPGAFTESLKTADVVARFNHDENRLLGRTSAGTATT